MVRLICLALCCFVLSVAFAEGEDDAFLLLTREKGLRSEQQEQFDSAVDELRGIDFQSDPAWHIFQEPLLSILLQYIVTPSNSPARRVDVIDLYLSHGGSLESIRESFIALLNGETLNESLRVCENHTINDAAVLAAIATHISSNRKALETYLKLEGPAIGVITAELIERAASSAIELLPKLIVAYGKIPEDQRTELSIAVHTALVVAAHRLGRSVFVNLDPVTERAIIPGEPDQELLIPRLAAAELSASPRALTYPGYFDQEPDPTGPRTRGRPSTVQQPAFRKMRPAPSFYIRGFFEPRDTHGVNCTQLMLDLLKNEGTHRFQAGRHFFG